MPNDLIDALVYALAAHVAGTLKGNTMLSLRIQECKNGYTIETGEYGPMLTAPRYVARSIDELGSVITGLAKQARKSAPSGAVCETPRPANPLEAIDALRRD